MSDERRTPVAALSRDEGALLWITGCCVGAVHAPGNCPDESIAWYLLEHADEAAGPLATPSPSMHA